MIVAASAALRHPLAGPTVPLQDDGPQFESQEAHHRLFEDSVELRAAL